MIIKAPLYILCMTPNHARCVDTKSVAKGSAVGFELGVIWNSYTVKDHTVIWAGMNANWFWTPFWRCFRIYSKTYLTVDMISPRPLLYLLTHCHKDSTPSLHILWECPNYIVREQLNPASANKMHSTLGILSLAWGIFEICSWGCLLRTHFGMSSLPRLGRRVASLFSNQKSS